MITKWWVSSTIGTGQVNVRDGIILGAPKLWNRFIGQPFENLTGWLRRRTGTEVMIEKLYPNGESK